MKVTIFVHLSLQNLIGVILHDSHHHHHHHHYKAVRWIDVHEK
jgi:hypothetical protein